MDAWEPTKVHSISRVSWFVLFVDNCSRFTWVYLMKQKFEVSTIFPIFHNMLKNQFDAKVLGIRSDNGNSTVTRSQPSALHTIQCNMIKLSTWKWTDIL